MALATGTKIGPNEIQARLGAGGMGEVYRARDTRLERTVAITRLLEPQLFESCYSLLKKLPRPVCGGFAVLESSILLGGERSREQWKRCS